LFCAQHFRGLRITGSFTARVKLVLIPVSSEPSFLPRRLNSLLKNSNLAPPGAKGLTEKKGLIAALKRCAASKSGFFRKL
jgi:hypothetical protein